MNSCIYFKNHFTGQNQYLTFSNSVMDVITNVISNMDAPSIAYQGENDMLCIDSVYNTDKEAVYRCSECCFSLADIIGICTEEFFNQHYLDDCEDDGPSEEELYDILMDKLVKKAEDCEDVSNVVNGNDTLDDNVNVSDEE